MENTIFALGDNSAYARARAYTGYSVKSTAKERRPATAATTVVAEDAAALASLAEAVDTVDTGMPVAAEGAVVAEDVNGDSIPIEMRLVVICFSMVVWWW